MNFRVKRGSFRLKIITIQHKYFNRSNFDFCKMGEIIYAVGGYEHTMVRTVLTFDGRKWETKGRLTIPRSALRVILLEHWTNPRSILPSEEQNLESQETLASSPEQVNEFQNFLL